MKKYLLLTLIPCLLVFTAIQNEALSATLWNINSFSGSNSSIIARPTAFVTGDTLNLQSNITTTSAIGNIGSFILNIKGNNYTLNSKSSYAGFTVASLGDYRFENINLNRFKGSTGGAILNSGLLTTNNVNFNNNISTNTGGALQNSGTANITGGSFVSNTAVTSGGAIYNSSGKTLYVTNTTFTGNSAASGGAIYNNGGSVTLSGGSFSSSTATGNGGLYIAMPPVA